MGASSLGVGGGLRYKRTDQIRLRQNDRFGSFDLRERGEKIRLVLLDARSRQRLEIALISVSRRSRPSRRVCTQRIRVDIGMNKTRTMF